MAKSVPRNFKHTLAGIVFPKYSLLLDQLNHNAALDKWIAGTDMPVFPDRTALHKFVSEMIAGAPVDYLEFGVYQGESIRMWAEFNKNPASRFVGFDSFEGLPEAWDNTMQAGAFDTGGNVPKIDDARVSFQAGWFNDTIPPFLKSFSSESRLIIHVDSDLYSSGLYVLTQLDSIAVPGTILMFDEFFSALHEFRAFRDYVSAYRRKLRALGCTGDTAGRVAFVYE